MDLITFLFQYCFKDNWENNSESLKGLVLVNLSTASYRKISALNNADCFLTNFHTTFADQLYIPDK